MLEFPHHWFSEPLTPPDFSVPFVQGPTGPGGLLFIVCVQVCSSSHLFVFGYVFSGCLFFLVVCCSPTF